MPSITGGNKDGFCGTSLGAWDAIRDHAGYSVDYNNTRDDDAVSFLFFAMRGTYGLKRSFMDFDTSGVTVKPASATLRVVGYTNGDSDIIVIKSTHAQPLVVGDFDSFDTEVTDAFGNSDGNGTGTLAGVTTSGRSITYSGEVSPWDANSSSSNDIVLTDAALDDMVDLDLLKVCLMDYDHDYLDQDNSTGSNEILESGIHWVDMGSGYEPRIDYTVAVAENATFFGANF